MYERGLPAPGFAQASSAVLVRAVSFWQFQQLLPVALMQEILRMLRSTAPLQTASAFEPDHLGERSHGELFIHEYPQVILHQVAVYPFVTQSVFSFGIASTPVQDLGLGLVELH